MREVFVVLHFRDFKEFGDEFSLSRKLIGIYTSAGQAAEAIRRARTGQGFADYPDGFRVERHVVDEDGMPEGFVPA